jgi:hypothetical protein
MKMLGKFGAWKEPQNWLTKIGIFVATILAGVQLLNLEPQINVPIIRASASVRWIDQ